MNQAQLDILNEIRVKMFYDPRKTLSEQSVAGAPDGGVIGTREPSKKPIEPENPIEKAFENVEIFPIPGYTTYMIPKINDANGGIAYYYFPLETTKIQKFTFPVCEDLKNKEFCKRYSITQPQLSKILPSGSIREFRIENDYYTASIAFDTSNGELTFRGYKNQDDDYYKSPNPEDFKTEFQKFLDNYGTIYQIVGSILVILVAEFVTGGMATPVAWRLALEILGELVVNIPVALYDYKKGNTISGNLSLLFAFLPFLDIRGVKGVTKEIAESISQKLIGKEIKNADDLGKFYESLSEEEQYVFYQVMKQNPDFFKQQYKEGLTKLFNQAVNNKQIIQKLLLKDQTWWKNLGIQGGVAFFIMVAKELTTKEFSQEEIERMTKFYLDISKQLKTDEERAKFNQLLVQDKDFAEKAVETSLMPEGEEKDAYIQEMINTSQGIYPSDTLSNN
jgi:hypothetical protein